MIPLRDNIPTRRRALVTWALILINALVFLYAITRPAQTLPAYGSNVPERVSGYDRFTAEYGLVPCELASRCDHPGRAELQRPDSDQTVEVRVPSEPAWLTAIAAMFMHGGWEHLLGNMLFLWIFGNNVEDSMGRLRFLAFYLLCGFAATAAQVLTDPGSEVVNIGASGAIAGVLGGYLVLYPRARVLTILPLVVFFGIVELPAAVVLAVWYALQLVLGAAGLVGPAGAGGVAYWAHIGGFTAGLVLIRLFARYRWRPTPPEPPLVTVPG